MEKWKRVIPWAACVLGLLMMYHPTFLSGFERMQTDVGDTRLAVFLLEHTWRWVRGLESFWELPSFYPVHGVGAWCENFIGVAPIYWLWRAFGFEADTALQLWMPTISALNFWCAYLALRMAGHLRGTRLGEFHGFDYVAASAGAFLFAFSAARTNQIGHQQTLAVFWTALAFWCLCRVNSRSSLWWVALGACVGLQFLSGVYLGWFLVFGLGLFALAWFFGRRWQMREVLSMAAAVALAGVVAALVVMPVAFKLLDVGKQFGYWRPDELYLPTWRSWVYYGPDSWFFPAVTQTFGSEYEYRLCFGLGTAVMAIIGLMRARSRSLLIASAAVVLLSTALWGYVYRFVPGAMGIRTVSRIGELILVPGMLGMAHFVARTRNWYVWPALLAMVAEQGVTSPSFDKQKSRDAVEAVAAAVPRSCGSFLFSPIDPGLGPVEYQIDAMLAAQQIGIPTVNGYSSHQPKGWAFDFPISDAEEVGKSAELDDAMASWEFQHGLPRGSVCLVKADAG